MSKNTQVKHGNYSNYYGFRSDDSRSNILRRHLLAVWNGIQDEYTNKGDVIHMLDVGCNAGNFTDKVYRALQDITKRKVRVIGVDIDAELCNQACTAYPDIDFITGNMLSIATRRKNNCVDPIDQIMQTLEIEQFDVICCFSVLMYIHLNGGDVGLRAVLDYLCHRGKIMILELQSWKKYRDQQRRLRRDGKDEYPYYEELEWRGGGGKLEGFIKNYIVSKGFDLFSESAEKSEFDRQLLFFKEKAAES